MIESLSVRNYVLIDRLDMDFSEGFTVLTGETGSGKSVILGALSLLLGGKADKDVVRVGAESAEISAVFHIEGEAKAWCEARDVSVEDDTVALRRVIRSSGRSSFFLNGSAITRAEGEELGMLLVDVSSQHEHQSLMRSDVQRSMLDTASSSLSVLESYREKWRELEEARARLSRTREEVEKSAEEADYMRYCLSELEEADLREGEEETLRERLSVQASSAYLAEAVTGVEDGIRSAEGSIGEALSVIRKAERKDPSLLSLSERIESMGIECTDIYETLRDYLSSLSFSETEIEDMNRRLSVIQRMKRRYGGSVESAIRERDSYREKLEMVNDSSSLIASLEKRVEKAEKACFEEAENLSALRREGAARFSSKIESNLKKLGMEAAVFTIRVSEDTPGPWGKDRIEYLIAANKGERTALIQNTSSGGELSRLLLAMKVSLEDEEGVDTVLFDEVDAGIGGSVANNVGMELRELAKRKQVITITHLAQIASRARSHFKVYKSEECGRTVTHIVPLEGEERVREIARILSGTMSDVSLEHARALLDS